MSEHELKTWPDYFDLVRLGIKTFELRIDDRGFQPYDTLILKEYCPISRTYSGKTVRVRVKYVLRLNAYRDVKGVQWAIARMLMPNLVILAIELESAA